MNLDAIHVTPDAARVPLDQLVRGRALNETEKLAEASRLFEALLLRQILRETQQPVIPSSLQEDSAATGIYRDLFCEHLADAIARSNTLGLAATLQQQLQPRTQHKLAHSSAAAPETTSIKPPASPAGRPASTRPAENAPSSARGVNIFRIP